MNFSIILTKIKTFLKRPKNLIFSIVGLVVLLIIVSSIAKKNGLEFETATAHISDIQQEVSVTGRIKPTEQVSLAFEQSGKISYVPVKIGQTVKANQILMSLDTSELAAQSLSQSAALRATQAKLDQLIQGPRTEDLLILQTNLDNAKIALEEIKTKTTIDVLRNGFNAAVSSMVTVTDLQNKYFNNTQAESIEIEYAKEKTIKEMYGEANLGKTQSWYFLSLQGGFKKQLTNAENNPETIDAYNLLSNLRNILSLAQNCLDKIYNGLIFVGSTDSEKTSISNSRSSLSTQITSIDTQKQSIISNENAVKNAQAQLDLKKSPASNFDLEITKSQVEQTQAGLKLIQAQISKKIIRSPIDGIISNIEGKVGEISTINSPAISVIGTGLYEIEANIAEADIAKVKTENSARVTLDAYGQDISWTAKVIQVYPAENMIEGVANYKTILQLPNDERIRSGMTANLDIVSGEKRNTLVIPQRAVIRKDDQKFVRLLIEKTSENDPRFADLSKTTADKQKTIIEIPIQTGLRGSDGNIEIISGLQENDIVIIK